MIYFFLDWYIRFLIWQLRVINVASNDRAYYLLDSMVGDSYHDAI